MGLPKPIAKFTASPNLEVRRIVFAEGGDEHGAFEQVIEPTTGGLKKDVDHVGLREILDQPLKIQRQPGKDDRYIHVNTAQGVMYLVHVVRTRTAFKAALENPDVLIIYAGHSRFGRGPCFGRDADPGEQWEDGDDEDTGIFRMGSPYVAPRAADISEHQYSADLVKATEKVKLADIDPLSSGPLVAQTASQIGVAPAFVKNKSAPKSTLWWSQGGGPLLHAGWEKTTAAPLDLGATKLQCIGLCHFGCTSLLHHQQILRKLKGYKKDVKHDRGHAYFTDKPSLSLGWIFFTYHLLAMPLPAPKWADSLEYAKQQANVRLAIPFDAKVVPSPQDQVVGFKIV